MAYHIVGKLLYTADALSRAPDSNAVANLQEEAEAYVENIAIPSLPAMSTKLEVSNRHKSRTQYVPK